jgi:hypothetical protein
MRSLGRYEGVLPLLDAHLPERPTRQNPAWLAMPIATPISRSLSGRPLEDVVMAIAAIADTLASLQRTHNLAHRDVKPGNLYELDGRWLIGDFGLVAVPDVDELTRTGRPLGPVRFMPDEMVLDAPRANPHSADVYSLAKTLWVLAVEQQYPPSGHQPADRGGYTIADQRPHAYAPALDRLVDMATRTRPEERPSKEQIAKDLHVWLELSGEPVAIDVSDIGARLRKRMAGELEELDIRETRVEMAHAAVRRLSELMAPLNAALREVHPRAEIDVMGDRLWRNYVLGHRHSASPEILFEWQRCSMIVRGPSYHRYVLRMARGVELEEDGTLVVRFMVDVGPDGVMHTDYHWSSDDRRALVGSIEADRLMEEGVRELAGRLPEGLKAFDENLPVA